MNHVAVSERKTSRMILRGVLNSSHNSASGATRCQEYTYMICWPNSSVLLREYLTAFLHDLGPEDLSHNNER
ncbi:MAG: hypothetical protein GPOALKHO_001777 [Sodalis sp.]|nr:MAG: hypothetical protein GPOALKHO_001777 [Sodalis sp.]